MTADGDEERSGSPRLAGLVVGFAAGVATLEVPTIGWLVVIAFLIGTARAHRLVTAAGAMLLGMGLAWTSLLLSGGVIPELVGWFATGLGMLVAGSVIVATEHVRRR